MAVEEVTPGEWVHRTPARDLNWNSVYADQLPRIYDYFRFRLGREADVEDLTARTFEKAWRSLPAPELFEHDTRGFGIPTRALDLIWGDKAGFEGKMRDLLAATDELAARGSRRIVHGRSRPRLRAGLQRLPLHLPQPLNALRTALDCTGAVQGG
ncbi:MAG: cytochrome c [Steroidobacteraceae bacterium]|nr:cytochrome c [Steroidobacteraceae bacterium]